MRTTSWPAVLLRFLIKVLLLDAAIALVADAICWIGGWRTAMAYSNSLFFVGVAVAALGLASLRGNLDYRADWRYLVSESAGVRDTAQRTAQMIGDLYQTYAFAVLTGAGGLGAVGLAILVYRVWG